jgi:hypothetical protein
MRNIMHTCPKCNQTTAYLEINEPGWTNKTFGAFGAPGGSISHPVPHGGSIEIHCTRCFYRDSSPYNIEDNKKDILKKWNL